MASRTLGVAYKAKVGTSKSATVSVPHGIIAQYVVMGNFVFTQTSQFAGDNGAIINVELIRKILSDYNGDYRLVLLKNDPASVVGEKFLPTPLDADHVCYIDFLATSAMDFQHDNGVTQQDYKVYTADLTNPIAFETEDDSRLLYGVLIAPAAMAASEAVEDVAIKIDISY